MKRLLMAASFALALSACNDQYAGSQRAIAPIPPRTVALMSEKGMSKSDPILIRLYKKESELEIWKMAQDGRYALLKTYPICRWSGQLGPKQREGDRQAPEGFYTVTPGQMNPNSAYYLSFDTGYPNAFDRSHGRTGSQLMVHGTCSSRGCYAMTDEGIAEVYAIAREAFAGGQKGFQFQAYPFRMTAENLTKFRKDPNMSFWANLKEGSDHFEVTKREPKVAVCGGRYAFDTVGGGCAPDPVVTQAVAEKEEKDRRAVAELVAKGVPAVKVVYADGGQHETFRETALGTGNAESSFALLDSRPRRNLGDVSRPDALAQGPREIALEENGKGTGTLVAAVSRKGAGKVAAAQVEPTAIAKPARTVLASADPDEPISAPAAAPEKPLYDRMLGGLLGRGTTPAQGAPAVTPPAREDAAAATLPPRRKPVAANTTKKPDSKPSARAPGEQATDAPKKHVDAGLIPGSASVGPVATAFRSN
jgi:murein L,D-transpeptidase YafK